MTPRHDAWRSGEMQVLYDLVNRTGWLPIARDRLAGRTDSAIHAKMCALRREAGITPSNPGPTAKAAHRVIREKAAAASTKLRRAIELTAA